MGIPSRPTNLNGSDSDERRSYGSLPEATSSEQTWRTLEVKEKKERNSRKKSTFWPTVEIKEKISSIKEKRFPRKYSRCWSKAEWTGFLGGAVTRWRVPNGNHHHHHLITEPAFSISFVWFGLPPPPHTGQFSGWVGEVPETGCRWILFVYVFFFSLFMLEDACGCNVCKMSLFSSVVCTLIALEMTFTQVNSMAMFRLVFGM